MDKIYGQNLSGHKYGPELHSNSPSNFFSIFNKVNPKAKTMDSEQGRGKRNNRISKKSPPDFKYTKISDHFRPK